MARTNRRREAGEIVNSKRKIQEIDPRNSDSWDVENDDDFYVR